MFNFECFGRVTKSTASKINYRQNFPLKWFSVLSIPICVDVFLNNVQRSWSKSNPIVVKRLNKNLSNVAVTRMEEMKLKNFTSICQRKLMVIEVVCVTILNRPFGNFEMFLWQIIEIGDVWKLRNIALWPFSEWWYKEPSGWKRNVFHCLDVNLF